MRHDQRFVPVTATSLLIGIVLFATTIVLGQEKRVNVIRLEVDGQEVSSKFTVDLISEEKQGKVYKAKVDDAGFIVPPELVGKDIGMIFRFKKFAAMFFFIKASNFDHDWTVGVDTKPFADDLVKASDPPDAEVVYYIKLDRETRPTLTTVVGKPKITIK